MEDFSIKDFLKKSENFNKVEFWAVTTFFVYGVFFFITDGLDPVSQLRASNKFLFDQAKIPYHYYENYFFPKLIRFTFLFLAFMILNFTVVPRLIRQEAVTRNMLLLFALFVLGGLVIGTTDTYIKNYLFVNFDTELAAYNSIFRTSFLYAFWLLLMLGLYSVIKYAGVYLLSNAEAIHAKHPYVTPGGLVAVVVWMIGLFVLLMVNADEDIEEVLAAWFVIVPSGILFYWYAFYSLIPSSLNKKKPFLIYIGKTILILLISFLPVSLFVLLITQCEALGFGMGMFNVAVQLLITAPLSWVIFRRQMMGKEEIYVLKTALGQSHANFDFLRSQINPHFLFNALNTIYGTAIQEKAERTSEGIEKLGDMMRFMLQENMQEKISLTREIEYLENYINLQKLRTDPNPNIRIQTQIECPPIPVQIAPMLLIPFVENAFKHGISFREPSHISITVEVRENTLYLDVYNSKHVKAENDPEKNKSGIGLSNVQQRLQLLYPGKHELMIRESGKEFFVHLTLQLS
ncbi:histidine kinase internal subunit [Flammeovirgaceae bacterium 311]|nr:histidine kinase internal subunit [Flammeovirgaceae bacterium 311]